MENTKNMAHLSLPIQGHFEPSETTLNNRERSKQVLNMLRPTGYGWHWAFGLLQKPELV